MIISNAAFKTLPKAIQLPFKNKKSPNNSNQPSFTLGKTYCPTY